MTDEQIKAMQDKVSANVDSLIRQAFKLAAAMVNLIDIPPPCYEGSPQAAVKAFKELAVSAINKLAEGEPASTDEASNAAIMDRARSE